MMAKVDGRNTETVINAPVEFAADSGAIGCSLMTAVTIHNNR
jgi:hypothetical protein